jgi:hypothetical protein
MKKNFIILALLSLLAFGVNAQEVNFRALNDTRHLVSAHFNVDYGSYYGLSYGYVLRTKYGPLVFGTEFTQPFGHEMLDDWKWKTSVQAEVFRKSNLSVVLKTAFAWKHHESPLATVQNFGSDFALNVGYVKESWGVVAVADYDKYITTRLKHHLLKDYYPEIKDGWYDQSGGNFKFGVRLQKSFGTWNSFLTAGKHYGADFKDNPTMPFYAEVSVQKRF